MTQDDGATATFDLCQLIATARAAGRGQKPPVDTGQEVDALSAAKFPHAENQQPDHQDLHRKGRSRASLTPELDGGLKPESSGITPEVMAQKLFPIFRPKTQWKVSL